MKEYKKVLCIAGSECLGCSGVQADIKAIAACGAYAAGALTCIVNMDTTHVKEVFPLPEDLVIGSVRSYLSDPGAEAIKMGMLFTKSLIVKLGEVLREYPGIPIVVDPVMVAASGDRLIELDAVEAYKTELFPLASIITPNFKEANLLLGHEFGKESVDADMDYLCQWGNATIVKSFREKGDFMDVFSNGQGKGHRMFPKQFIETKNVNGTGCTFSSSMAAYIAQGNAVEESVALAETYINGAIAEGALHKFGAGYGPVCHAWKDMK